ncbi:MAG: 1,4-dihydroxy-2-naphthoate polyprenyltransferase [Pseudoclavibacter sp.]|nr:1,4-dihydroxy-2-naphthoate polyprenyltransferase [Pseudoclavibacter sp.]
MAKKKQHSSTRRAPARSGSGSPRGRGGGRRGPGRARARELSRRDRMRLWLEGARLRTLPLAVVPVLLGTAGAVSISQEGEYHWARALACLAVAVCLQIGVNFANDYSDGVRGTDRHRVGPLRLTASGLVPVKTVRTIAFLFFLLAAAAGVFLAWRTGQWWLLAVGAAAILAAWFYTGGKRPYGYFGLGEVFVFLFFGLVATLGTMYVQVLQISSDGWLLAIASGLFACAALMANNIRDAEQDRAAGKRTLAVLLGRVAPRVLYGLFALGPFVISGMFLVLFRNAIYSFFALMLIAPAVLIVATSERPRDLVLALRLTTLGALAFALLLGLAIALSPYRPALPPGLAPA